MSAIRAVPGREHFLASSEFPTAPVPLVYLVDTKYGGFSLVVFPGGRVDYVRLPQLTPSAVRAQASAWLTSYANRGADRRGWARTFDAVTRWAWTAAIEPVLEHLRGQERAALIPGGLLGLLPLHAGWTPDGTGVGGRRYALDELLLTYAPSAAVLEEVSAHLPGDPVRSLLAVADPQPVSARALPWATREVAYAAGRFFSVDVLAAERATRAAVVEHLDGHDVLHFACHGFAHADPRQSGLLLAHDESLALSDLASMRLTSSRGDRPRLAVLSACECGVPGAALPDEVIGLPAGLLAAGVHGVVASLFAVPDEATGLLMTRFYMTWTTEREPAHALRDAQRWLRDATNEQLYATFGAGTTGAPPATPAARRLWSSARPYADAIEWAGFTYVGA